MIEMVGGVRTEGLAVKCYDTLESTIGESIHHGHFL